MGARRALSLWIVIPVGLLWTANSAAQSVPADSAAFVMWVEALRDISPDPTRGSHVAGLVIERDAGRLEFTWAGCTCSNRWAAAP